MTATRTHGRLGAAARGLCFGVGAGMIWFGIEFLLAYGSGSIVPTEAWGIIALIDVAVAGLAGALVLAVAPRLGYGRVAIVVAGAYGLMRVFSPPGIGSEALYLLLATLLVCAAPWLVGDDRDRSFAAFHVVALMAAALLVGELLLDSARAGALRGVRLPAVVAGLGLAGLLVDRIMQLLVARRSGRVLVQGLAAALALLVWGRPLDVRAHVDSVVTGVPPPKSTPDVILVSLDTTRADHLSTYGYERETSPNLTRFARDARRYEWARSPAAWTLPGHASMMTGLYPSTHGAHLAGGWLGGQSIDGRRNVAYPLASKHTTLAELLRDRGYHTGAFVANFSYLYRDYGIVQGFGTYDDAPGTLLRVQPPSVLLARQIVPGFCLKPFRSADDINARALAWLDTRSDDRPNFLFINYMEPHQPWLAAEPFDAWARALPEANALARQNLYTHAVQDIAPETAAFITANYDGQILAMDAALGRFLDALRARGRYENALIIVTSDHGELLGEHSEMGHMGRTLYEPLVHIPLIVKYPGADRPRDVSPRPVQLVDLLPTVAALTGVTVPAEVEGAPLDSVVRPSFAEVGVNPFLVADYGAFYDRAVRAIYDGRYKLITTSRGERMLFDLVSDPGETRNRAEAEPEQRDRLLALLERRVRTTVASADGARRRQ